MLKRWHAETLKTELGDRRSELNGVHKRARLFPGIQIFKGHAHSFLQSSIFHLQTHFSFSAFQLLSKDDLHFQFVTSRDKSSSFIHDLIAVVVMQVLRKIRLASGLLFGSVAIVLPTAAAAETPASFLWAKTASGRYDEYANAISVDAAGNTYVVGRFFSTATFGSFSLRTSKSTDGDIFLVKFNSSGTVLWAKQAGGTGSDEAYGVKVDPAGNNVYVTGRFTGTATFGTTNLTSSGTHEMFLAKYDNAGNLIWARKAGGTTTDYAFAVTLDGLGNAYLAGVFTGTATFGNATLTSAGTNGYKDVFIAKYDGSGNFLWARKAGGTGTDVGYGIAADSSGNVFVAGTFELVANFGGFDQSPNGNQDIFIAKYDSAGNFLWANSAGGVGGYNFGYAVAADNGGNAYLTGSFRTNCAFFLNTTNFDSIDLTAKVNNATNSDAFLAKYDPGGNLLWVRQAGGTNADDGGYAVAVDDAGSAYVAGFFGGTAGFTDSNLMNSGAQDVFVAKYDAAGNFLWAKQAGGTYYDYANGIALDSSGKTYIAGTFGGAAAFGTNSITGSGNNEIFVAVLNSTFTPATNRQPVLDPIAGRTVNEGSTLTLTVTATDPDVPPQTLTFSLVSAPVGATITPGGVLTWTPGAGQGGATNTFSARVTDNGSPNLSDTKSFTVVVNVAVPELLFIDRAERVPPRLNLHFAVEAGKNYVVQYADSLGSWKTLQYIPALSVPTNLVIPDFRSAETQSYYRVYSLLAPIQTHSIDLVARTPASFNLYFTAAADQSYIVEYAGSLISGSWQTLTNIPASPSSRDLLISDAMGSDPQRFYRLNAPLMFGQEVSIVRLEVAPEEFHLHFAAQAGRSYSVEYRNSLTAGDWSTLTNLVPAVTTTNLVISDVISAQPQRFYRLKSP